jgi:hypothetical protein
MGIRGSFSLCKGGLDKGGSAGICSLVQIIEATDSIWVVISCLSSSLSSSIEAVMEE